MGWSPRPRRYDDGMHAKSRKPELISACNHEQNSPFAPVFQPFIHSFSQAISIAPLQVHYYSEALRHSTDRPTVSEFHAEAHRQLRAKDLPKVSTHDPSVDRRRLNQWAATPQMSKRLMPTCNFSLHFFSYTARDLGAHVLLDQELTFAPHLHRLNVIAITLYMYQLGQLRTVARSLTVSAATTLVHVFITSRL